MAKKDAIEQIEIEAPYELPEGWKWCRLGDIAETLTGSTPSKKNPKFYQGTFPFFKPTDLEQGINLFQASEYLSEEGKNVSRIIPANSTLICCIGSIGKSGYSLREGTANQQINAVIPNDKLDSKFLFYSVNTENFINQLWNKSSSTTISIVNKSKMDSCVIPLPPTLAEQQRIVNRIETMFAKLDQAQEKAQSVLDSFETRKAAILHKAFTGELTANWRKENGVLDDSWKEKTVGDCCVEVKVGIVIKPTRYYTEAEKGIPAFRSANVRENHIDDFDWVYINDEGMKNEQRSIVHTNDVLVVRSGAPGTACVVTDQFDGYNAIDILIAVPTQDIINSYFLCYYTNSPMGKNIVAEKKRGLGLTHFNVKGYSATPIKVPTLPEQQEIVRILDTVLEKETRAKEAAQTVLDQIDLLKKSILARAFRGEL